MRIRVLVLCGLAALTACSPPQDGPTPLASSGGVPSQTVSPVVSASPTPSPSAVASYPASLPTDDPEKAAVIAGWQEYWRVYEKYAADPSLKDLTETQYVTTGAEANEVLDMISDLRRQGLRSEGGRVFSNVTVSPESGTPRRAAVKYCVSVDSLILIEISTGQRVPRTGQYLEVAVLENMKDGTWRVSHVSNEDAQC